MIDFVPGNDNTGDGIIIGNGGLLALNGGEAYRTINGILNDLIYYIHYHDYV